MMAYRRYQNELRSKEDYFRDIKAAEVSEDSSELAESLIKKKSSKFDLSSLRKLRSGCEGTCGREDQSSSHAEGRSSKGEFGQGH
jgi:hypothetical protein